MALPENLTNAMLPVQHALLAPFTEPERMARECPVCEVGLLLVRRDHRTMEISEFDRCCLCGQPVQYTDVVDLRKRDKWKHGLVP